MVQSKRGVVLLSGGIDSTTVLALAKSQGFEIFALSFDYGQRHRCELAAARRVAEQLGAARHLIAAFDLRAFGGSALTSNAEIPKHRNIHKISLEIPITYVPARNTIFLSFALAWCEVLEASDIFIGANAIDYSGYPDCRPAFIASFENLANLATKAAVEGRAHYHIHAPLLHMSKAQIIRAGYEAGVDFALTHSCYDPDEEGLACGACDSCQLRRQGFREAGLRDPTHYSNPPR